MYFNVLYINGTTKYYTNLKKLTGLSFLWHAANMRCRRGLHIRSRILGPFLEHGDDCVNGFSGRLHAFFPPTRQDDPNTWGSITTWPSLVVISSLGTELKFPHSPHKLPTKRNITFVNNSKLHISRSCWLRLKFAQ